LLRRMRRWFSEADRRIRWLIDQGLIPCIVGGWGYYRNWMTVEQTIRHWRELIAWWGAYPIVWCIAGEAPLPWYETIERAVELGPAAVQEAFQEQAAIWTRVVSEVRRIEPYGRLFAIHSIPDMPPHKFLGDDEAGVDLWLLQTGHWGVNTLGPSVDALSDALRVAPVPVINGEVCYEGIAGSSWQDVQRFLFWSHLLSGAAGHSCGAQGIWGFNTDDYPAGLVGSWARVNWRDAAELPGASQPGLARQWLTTQPWARFDPHPEWVTPHAHPGDRLLPYAAGMDVGPRIFYFPSVAHVKDPRSRHRIELRELGDQPWSGEYFNPRTGQIDGQIEISTEGLGRSILSGGLFSPLPSMEDWIVVIRRQ
jgi:Protein of unknown function (DUF4038)